MRRPICLGIVLLLGLAAARAEAGWFGHRERGTPPPGRPRTFEHSLARAGDPLAIGPYAAPTQTEHYYGYYVGGGVPCGGCPRRPEDGTWGRDYVGTLLPRHVFLGWTHGRRAQGGTGAYQTDGSTVGMGR